MGLLFSSLWRKLWKYKEFKICIVGLDNAGKTTTLFQLHLGEVVETQPTIGSNVEEVIPRPYPNLR
jgi:ADP-ribosylation factor-like protein 5B